MNCQNCRHENANEARFCAQCGAPLTQPVPVASPAQTSTAPAARSAGGSKTALIVLGVVFGVLLLFAVGVYAAFHMAATKLRTLASRDTQTVEQPSDSKATAAGTSDAKATAAATDQGAQVTGNVIGSVLGTDAKGKSDIGKALDNMAQTGQQIDQHNKASGDTNGIPNAADTQQAVTAVGGLLKALGGSLGGASRHDPVDFHMLEALLPSSLSGMQHGTPKGNADDVVGIKTASADVDFNGSNDAHINVSIKDATAISGLAGLAEMASASESEQGESYEKNETISGRSVHEKWDAASHHGELSLIVGKRFGVDVVGNNVDMDALKNALAQIDLGKLEAMKDANPQAK
jgi:flagellar basal body-associated protein FliL